MVKPGDRIVKSQVLSTWEVYRIKAGAVSLTTIGDQVAALVSLQGPINLAPTKSHRFRTPPSHLHPALP